MQQSSPDSHKRKTCLLRQTYPQNLEAKQRIYAESRIRKLVNLRQTAFSNQLSGEAMPKAVNTKLVNLRQTIHIKTTETLRKSFEEKENLFYAIEFYLAPLSLLAAFCG